jgi:cobalt/nickel transport system ATP-binding protein
MVKEIVKIGCIRHQYSDSTEVNICGLNFLMHPGEKVALLGANGCGKTTLLSHIIGLLSPTEGEVQVLGLNPAKDFKKLRGQIGVLLQTAQDQLIGPTVWDDVAFAPQNARWPREVVKERVDRVLAELGIRHLASKIPHYLSGGEQQKVALAGALVMSPRLLVLDEPFSRVDQRSRKEIIQLLLDINARDGTALLFTTHDWTPVAPLADTVYVMRQGEILSRGTPGEILTDRELLRKAGLETPDLLELFYALKEKGVELPPTLSLEEAAAVLWQAIRKQAGES